MVRLVPVSVLVTVEPDEAPSGYPDEHCGNDDRTEDDKPPEDVPTRVLSRSKEPSGVDNSDAQDPRAADAYEQHEACPDPARPRPVPNPLRVGGRPRKKQESECSEHGRRQREESDRFYE